MAHSPDQTKIHNPSDPILGLHAILKCHDINLVVQDRKIYSASQFRHSPTEVEEYTYRLATILVDNHPKLNLRLFWTDPVLAARESKSIPEEGLLFKAIKRFANISRGCVEFVPTVPPSKLAGANVRKAWLCRALPPGLAFTRAPRVLKMLGEDLSDTSSQQIVPQAVKPLVELKKKPLAKPMRTPPPVKAVPTSPVVTPPVVVPVETPSVSTPGSKILNMLSPPEWAKGQSVSSSAHSIESVKSFSSTLAKHLLVNHEVVISDFVKDPVGFLRRTDVNLDRDDRALALAIIRFAHLTKDRFELVPGSPKPVASAKTRLEWIALEDGGLVQLQPEPLGTSSAQKEPLTRDKLIDLLVTAKDADLVTLEWNDKRILTGRLVFNLFRLSGTLIDLEGERSHQFTIGEIRNVRYSKLG